jgi:hypothetical protein|eukprot:239242-Prymnesium_polylepis.5
MLLKGIGSALSTTAIFPDISLGIDKSDKVRSVPLKPVFGAVALPDVSLTPVLSGGAQLGA